MTSAFDLIDKKFKPEPPEEEYCERCEDGGWVQVHSERPPAFAVCPDCYNPKGYPSP